METIKLKVKPLMVKILFLILLLIFIVMKKLCLSLKKDMVLKKKVGLYIMNLHIELNF